MSEKPASVIDPICGMTVIVAAAEARGLTVEYEGRMYAFCGPGCRRTFVEEPARYAAAPALALAGAGVGHGGGAGDASAARAALPVIDEGMRRWYESCSCCLGDTYPEIKAQLDAERAAAAQVPVDPGIREVAEGATEGASSMADRRRLIRTDEDPVCGMTVDPDMARLRGLVHTHESREYVFCGKGCMLEFRDDPERYLAAGHRPSM